MGRVDVEAWAAEASTGDDTDQEGSSSGPFWSSEKSASEWPKALEYARSKLLSASTRVRSTFLKQDLLSVIKREDLTLSQTLDVFQLLTLTYPRYVDTISRDAVEAVGMEIVRRDEVRGTPQGPQGESKLGVTEQILGWLAHEVGGISKRGSSSSYAASNMYVLLSWSCGLYTVCLEANPDFTSSQAWEVLARVMALLTDMVLHPGTRSKPSLQRSALVRTRRALRSHPPKVPVLMETLIRQAKAHSSPLSFIPLLGSAVDVTLRLKNVKDQSLRQVPASIKNDMIGLYTNSVLLSKSPVSAHALSALHDFIRDVVSPEDFERVILPTMEKSVLRSPEYSLNVMREFFVAYSHALQSDSFRRVAAAVINSSKSNNVLVRTTAVALFQNIATKSSSPEDLEFLVNELLTLPKTGKTSGPEHRVALFSMLDALPPSPSISLTILQNVPALFSKESHEAAITMLISSLAVHITSLLKSKEKLPAEALSLVAKEMNSPKPAVRRAFCALTGNVFWTLGDLKSDPSVECARAVLPAIETNLKTVSANPVAAVAGPLEGYIAVAVILGAFLSSGKFDDLISKNAIIKTLGSTSPKPAFLFWDKVYQKLSTLEEEVWFLRACEVSVIHLANEIVKSQALSSYVGSAFLHLAVDSRFSDIRRQCVKSLETLSSRVPKVVSSIAKEGLLVYLVHAKPSLSLKTIEDESEKPILNLENRLAAVLLASASFSDDCDVTTKQDILADLINIAHHPTTCGKRRQVWIEMCQKAGLDPQGLINNKLDAIFHSILAASDSSDRGLVKSSYRVLSTIAFVAPAAVLPRAMDQLRLDISASDINSLTDTDLGIWATPEGATYIDVLSNKKDEAPIKKGKGADIAKWEAELRKSLANKKAVNSGKLSKQDQALVQAQLDKEAVIRHRVTGIKFHLQRGLAFVRSIVAARVDDFRAYVSNVATLLLHGAFDKGVLLCGYEPYHTYLDLSSCCSERLDLFRPLIGAATLRSLQVSGIPEEMRAEPLNHLVSRILYRLRFLSEQAPLDAATFSYAYPLLSQVLVQGGIALSEEDDPLEQITLALDIVRFHCSEFGDSAFPRAAILTDLIHAIRNQPRLAKDAASALIDSAQAVSQTASPEESSILLRGTLHQEVYARNACLQALQPFDLTELDWSIELWIAMHDDDEQNVRLAQTIWEDNGLDVPEAFLEPLLDYLGHDNSYVRSSAAAGLADAVQHYPQLSARVVKALERLYRDKAKILAPEFDQYGMVIEQSLNRIDPWQTRQAVARTFQLIAPYIPSEEIENFFTFLIKDEALGDGAPEVRREMLQAATVAVDVHGAQNLASLIALFEQQLASPGSASEASDYIKEAVVILFGRVARHLDRSDKRIPTIVDRLVEALKTPSEQVQIAVADCLGPLVAGMGTEVAALVDKLMEQLFSAPKYAARRGAAYGLAGVIKGVGIAAMTEYDILGRIREAAADKKRFEARQGAMFALETFSNMLGRLFEPYVMHVLPLLLTSFGDAVADVREATQDAARVIMGNLSGFGIKLILPSLLSGLDEKQWRTKRGSIELLGMMAYCSPKQLSQSLPIVIPRLTGVLTDSHAQVRAAANQSLKQFGEVISNPEIKHLSPVLLKALVDPGKTPNALSSLLKTSFVHYIDQSSLALVVPIIERGLRERGADVKKKAAQIVGNLASLTDTKDFVPYLPTLLPMVHVVLVDPVPEARATAAKALGTLVERLGEGHFPDLVPGLMRTLKTDTSGVDRQGAAQGLSEVLAGLGMERLEGLLPDIIANAQSPRSTVREGFMTLLVFLPVTFGARFQPHLPKLITPILSGLADSEEYVREASMRAGRMIVTNYASKAIDLLLPELERGMFDPGWRIRQSSITLVGELLFKISGISGKAEMDDEEEVVDDTGAAETSKRALVETLGVERRDRILSALYLARQDPVVAVRQAAMHIWKALVHNTPRTVREILPELMAQIIRLLSSSESDQQDTAARTIADLCRKSGERMFAEVISVLRSNSTSLDARTRQGVCLAISELLPNTGENQREGHEDEIISMVRQSLVDDEADVRSAAAKAFDVLQEELGVKAIDQTIPTLLEALRQPGASSGTALHALREVMSVRSSTVFPVLIPTLTTSPMSAFNARALASLVTVAGNALSKRVSIILTSLIKELESNPQPELRDAIDEALRSLLASVSDPEGLNTLMLLLLGWCKSDSSQRRASSLQVFATFCEVSELDDSLYRVDWIRQLVSSMDEQQEKIHTAAWHALDVFVKRVPKDELEPLVVPLRRTIESTGTPGHHVPGFSLPKGVSPLVPIVIAGLTTGSNEQREHAAYAIGDLVERTAEDAIKPFVVPFTGPLIRVATQATSYPPGVKVAILTALTTMLERIPAFVKPFFPQLQRTFVKSASDASSLAVRNRAADALGVLMQNQPRVDPVVTELISGARSSEDSIAASLVLALANVIKSAHINVGAKAKEACVDLIQDAFKEDHEDTYVQAIAKLMSSLAPYPELLKPIVNTYLVAGTPPSPQALHAILAVLSPEEDGGSHSDLFQVLGVLRSVAQKVAESCGSDRSSIARPAREARELLKQLDDEALQGAL
ncbi:ARM repeat-containing protein [Gloeophyllum trabeum ATCC 11539]|uniref:eIF-2-alpha kinase activator GCN1 n=1 Tax=Gloeophyllum trabeum (strain ATCC 11539 / FP-39264 / Madison 617) TaxID=670483 RepID=S7Q7B5_GLOTA|nr:ARM repeat-containing protein [Gloeophyllum trabeum ATCC 11539]EPQ55338.1 ARM repeat-containing protein [Gloeophyllum trabeum ATCC 11539]